MVEMKSGERVERLCDGKHHCGGTPKLTGKSGNVDDLADDLVCCVTVLCDDEQCLFRDDVGDEYHHSLEGHRGKDYQAPHDSHKCNHDDAQTDSLHEGSRKGHERQHHHHHVHYTHQNHSHTENGHGHGHSHSHDSHNHSHSHDSHSHSHNLSHSHSHNHHGHHHHNAIGQNNGHHHHIHHIHHNHPHGNHSASHVDNQTDTLAHQTHAVGNPPSPQHTHALSSIPHANGEIPDLCLTSGCTEASYICCDRPHTAAMATKTSPAPSVVCDKHPWDFCTDLTNNHHHHEGSWIPDVCGQQQQGCDDANCNFLDDICCLNIEEWCCDDLACVQYGNTSNGGEPPLTNTRGNTANPEQQTQNNANEANEAKKRFKWTKELNERFEYAVEFIGVDKVKPREIIFAMDVDPSIGLTPSHIRSKLQKYRKKVAVRRELDKRSGVTRRVIPNLLNQTNSSSTSQGNSFSQSEAIRSYAPLFPKLPLPPTSGEIAPKVEDTNNGHNNDDKRNDVTKLSPNRKDCDKSHTSNDENCIKEESKVAKGPPEDNNRNSSGVEAKPPHCHQHQHHRHHHHHHHHHHHRHHPKPGAADAPKARCRTLPCAGANRVNDSNSNANTRGNDDSTPPQPPKRGRHHHHHHHHNHMHTKCSVTTIKNNVAVAVPSKEVE